MLLDYGLAPWVVNEEMTEEMLALLFISRKRRIRRENARLAGDGAAAPGPIKHVPDNVLFSNSQNLEINGKPVQGLNGIRPRRVVAKPQ